MKQKTEKLKKKMELECIILSNVVESDESRRTFLFALDLSLSFIRYGYIFVDCRVIRKGLFLTSYY